MRPELTQAIELLQSDSPADLERAIAMLQQTVYSFSMKVCGHPEDAEDTMQEVLYRSLSHLAKLQEPRALAVWLYTVTRNRCWRMRRKGASVPKEILSLGELMPDEVELGRLLKNASDSPEANVLRGEEHEKLHRAILRIPPPLRLVLVLHDMEELTTEEVAQVLDLQPGTVRVRLHRARLGVRKELSRSGTISTGRKTPGSAKRLPSKRRPLKPSQQCREMFAQLSEYLDGHMEPRSCDEMQQHIDACPSCVAFLRDLRSAIDRCRSMKVSCDPAVAKGLRKLLTREYLRLLGTSRSGVGSPQVL
ncbi:MAG TPA: sigma-70 family RNA polymerase sigma factor [Terracidiphilus sp.]|nr:sigma-70 family RNA polymerase sigma factor [Terracidiphilus sp.]